MRVAVLVLGLLLIACNGAAPARQITTRPAAPVGAPAVLPTGKGVPPQQMAPDDVRAAIASRRRADVPAIVLPRRLAAGALALVSFDRGYQVAYRLAGTADWIVFIGCGGGPEPVWMTTRPDRTFRGGEAIFGHGWDGTPYLGWREGGQLYGLAVRGSDDELWEVAASLAA